MCKKLNHKIIQGWPIQEIDENGAEMIVSK